MELTTLEITAVPTDVVLARVVTVLNARGARVRELRCSAGSPAAPAGVTYIRCVVETAGGPERVVAALTRVVDVTGVEVVVPGSARLSALA